jgi:hypothetical protein
MNIPASMASIAMIAPRPLKNKAGTSATTPEIISQRPSSNIPKFFVKFIDIFLSLSVGRECDGGIRYYRSNFPFNIFSMNITL